FLTGRRQVCDHGGAMRTARLSARPAAGVGSGVRAPWPWLRAGVAALVGVGLALAARGSADGRLPSPLLLALAVAGATVLARPFAGHERRLPGLLAGLTAAQLGLHAVFLFAATGQLAHPGVAGWLCCGDGRPVPAGGGMRLALPVLGGVTLTRAVLVQLLAHAAAVAVNAWWMRRAERRMWAAAARAADAVVRAAAALVRGLLAALGRVPIVAGPAPVFRRAPRGAPPGYAALLARCRPRRGPPLAA
ncbi:MAG: hypothetical protein V7637_5733, partial [Mycobacteriales bacterium]